MNRRFGPRAWAALLLLSLLAAVTALNVLPRALPMLDLAVRMSRTQALDAARALHEARFAELTTAREAVRFEHDAHLQTYIELEGGGLEAYRALLSADFIAPYRWTVRRFAPGQEDELRVSFTPDGKAYGFMRKVPEGAPGAALSETDARAIAERGAREVLGEARWAGYAPLSASQLARPGGRVDHRFEYEHRDERRGEARFRLRLAVAGDRLVELSPYAFIPEGFNQRFTNLREANGTIGAIAGIGAFAILGLGGVVGGGLWLARRRGIAWRPALIAGGIVGLLSGAAVLANLPASWFGYATTDAANDFILRQTAGALLAAVGGMLLLGSVYAVADGLSRRAQAGQPALFRAWSAPAAASPQILGRTLGGFAWTGFELLYVVAFYLVARNVLGWWVPAESLSDPNILSSWRPALQPIANALQAGTLEEALFRAVPLAGAVLLGRHLGRPRLVIGIALVLQAALFAGAHASYPGLPGYSRLVELFGPALLWGGFYLAFGLLPCMVMHFLFDLALMSLPIFVADDAGLWFDRLLVIAAGLAPLLAIALARLRQGRFAELPDALRYAADAAAPAPVELPPPASSAAAGMPTATTPRGLRPGPLLVAGLLAIGVLAVAQRPPLQSPPFTARHAEAIAQAEAALAQRGVTLDAQWKRLAIPQPPWGGELGILFAWRTAGAEVTQGLIGDTIMPAHWQVNFRRFDGPVEERSESWRVWLDGTGKLLNVSHGVPEARPGTRLERTEAEAAARQLIASRPDLVGRPWELAEASHEERPARRDWWFRFDDKARFDAAGGTRRLVVSLVGDEPFAETYVFVPDAFKRELQTRESSRTPLRMAGVVGVAVLVLWGLIVAFRRLAHEPLHWRPALVCAALMLVANVGQSALAFDGLALRFSTAMDWTTQVGILAGTLLVGQGLMAALAGAMLSRLMNTPGQRAGSVRLDLLYGAGLALVFAALAAASHAWLPTTIPPIAKVDLWNSLAPTLSAALHGVGEVADAVLLVGFVAGLAAFCTTTRRHLAVAALALIAALCSIFGAEDPGTGAQMVVPVLASIGLVWWLVRRGETRLAFVATALGDGMAALALSGLDHAGALGPAIASTVVTLALTGWVLRDGRAFGSAVPP